MGLGHPLLHYCPQAGTSRNGRRRTSFGRAVALRPRECRQKARKVASLPPTGTSAAAPLPPSSLGGGLVSAARRGRATGMCHGARSLELWAVSMSTPKPAPVVVFWWSQGHVLTPDSRLSTSVASPTSRPQKGDGPHGHHEVRILDPGIKQAIVRYVLARGAMKYRVITW